MPLGIYCVSLSLIFIFISCGAAQTALEPSVLAFADLKQGSSATFSFSSTGLGPANGSVALQVQVFRVTSMSRAFPSIGKNTTEVRCSCD